MFKAPPRLIGLILGVLLVSCGAARTATHPAEEALSQQVLFLEESLDGEVTAHWVHADAVDLSRYLGTVNTHPLSGHIVRVARYQRDCDAENAECVDDCMSRPLAPGYGHITKGRGKGGKMEFCRGRCWRAYLDCSKAQETQPQKFSAADEAMVWMKDHHRLLLVGGVVVIAGVAFVVVSATAGLVILAPVALLAST